MTTMFFDPDYMNEWFRQDADMLDALNRAEALVEQQKFNTRALLARARASKPVTAPTAAPALVKRVETRRELRRRVIGLVMAQLRHDDDFQAAAQVAWEDASAEVLIPDVEDRERWGYGIVSFCETALRYR